MITSTTATTAKAAIRATQVSQGHAIRANKLTKLMEESIAHVVAAANNDANDEGVVFTPEAQAQFITKYFVEIAVDHATSDPLVRKDLVHIQTLMLMDGDMLHSRNYDSQTAFIEVFKRDTQKAIQARIAQETEREMAHQRKRREELKQKKAVGPTPGVRASSRVASFKKDKKK